MIMLEHLAFKIKLQHPSKYSV